jgi:hypothetical protein
MLDHPIQDPEVARLRGELQASLANMAAGMEKMRASMESRHNLAYDLAVATITFRVDQGLEKRLASFMRQSGLRNQARAVRLLMEMALTTAGVKE